MRRDRGIMFQRHCEPTGRANARPMTGSAKQSIFLFAALWIASLTLAMTASAIRNRPRSSSPGAASRHCLAHNWIAKATTRHRAHADSCRAAAPFDRVSISDQQPFRPGSLPASDHGSASRIQEASPPGVSHTAYRPPLFFPVVFRRRYHAQRGNSFRRLSTKVNLWPGGNTARHG